MSPRKLSDSPRIDLEDRTVVIFDIPVSDSQDQEMLLYELRKAIKRYLGYLADKA